MKNNDLSNVSTEDLRKELENRGIKTTKQRLSMYGVPMKDTCHKGKECGIIGLGCRNPNCPHI
jgi:hypothetical protein